MPAMLVVISHALRVSAPTPSEEARFRSLAGESAKQFLWCPDDNADPSGTNCWHQLGLGDQNFILSGSPLASSYATNGALCGFDYRAETSAHLRGLLSKLRNASQVALLVEATQSGGVMAWRVAGNPSIPKRITLANGLDGSGLASGPQLPKRRHRRRVNIAYADGHVDNLEPTVRELDTVILAEGDSN
jgi:prepilin-type processing-associated H-X9-DG protein